MNFTSDCYESKRGDTLFRVTMKKEDGQIVTKTLELSSYLKLLDASKVREEAYINLSRELIPEGYIDGHYAGPQTFTCVWEVKGRKRQLVYNARTADGGIRPMQMPYPDLVFGLSVLNGTKQAFYCFARKDGSSRLYQYPFGNVNSSGSVCMGSIATTTVTPRQIEEDFFLGVTNDDYFNGMQKCGMEWSQTRLFKELVGREKYPDNWLVEANMTIEDFIKKFAK